LDDYFRSLSTASVTVWPSALPGRLNVRTKTKRVVESTTDSEHTGSALYCSRVPTVRVNLYYNTSKQSRSFWFHPDFVACRCSLQAAASAPPY